MSYQDFPTISLERILPFLARRKEFIGTAVVVIASILFLGYYDQYDGMSLALQGLIVAIGVFLVIPILYCKIILGRPLSSIGFQRGNPWAGVGGSLLALPVALGALFVLWNFTPLLKDYRLPVAVEEQFLFFVLYEVFLTGSIVFLYEVFFRGFLMLLWLRSWGIWGVIAQTLIFVLVLFMTGADAGIVPALIFAPFAGLIAYQSRSIWYSYGASWFYFFLTDALILIFR